MNLFRFTIRDVLWLTAVVVFALWSWRTHSRLALQNLHLRVEVMTQDKIIESLTEEHDRQTIERPDPNGT
jgi:hypothetical protein